MQHAKPEFEGLFTFLGRVPAIEDSIASGRMDDKNWWVKFSIDVDHPQAWNVVQELGHVLNYISLESRLPTVFMPVSPPPYINGPAREFLSWVIESTDPEFTPDNCARWLEGRLPKPVDDLKQWLDDEELDEDS